MIEFKGFEELIGFIIILLIPVIGGLTGLISAAIIYRIKTKILKNKD